ncbi:lytic polysaccharide monooxygenase [Streptomyces sp. NPDC098789]|uniref:lytic polysaccharide monooxygenase auxiliary activity family 9 protein n=1 Tax=Streptomyces sp. NPDC098789 TaxID=3366098 RepID=UPI0038055C7B
MTSTTPPTRPAPRAAVRSRGTVLGSAAGVVVLALAVTATGVTPAAAHGATGDPVSRSVACSKNPTNPACAAAWGVSKGQVYDWQSIVQGQAMDHSTPSSSPQHRGVIPDGKLCSANKPDFAGLDLPRSDFPSTQLPSGREYTLKYDISALHNPYRMEMYVTKDGYDPKKPLKWDDLEPTPFLSADNTAATTAPDGYLGRGKQMFTFLAQLPEKKGEHLIYTIWHGLKKPDGSAQSSEAFYSCSDVDFK